MTGEGTTATVAGRSSARSSNYSGLDLVVFLLAVLIVELAVYRLAVPQLTPPGNDAPPGWHQFLAWAGLFLFYSASALAMLVLAKQLYRQLRTHRYYSQPVRYALVFVATGFLVLAVAATISVPSSQLSFLLDLLFTLVLVVLVLAQLTAPGDVGTKVGLVLLATPLIMHFYAPFAVRFFEPDEIGLSALPEQVRALGQWSLVFCALAAPYCFAPRPFIRSASRPAPIAVATFVGVIGAIIFRKNPADAIEIASSGFGVDINANAPPTMVALYILALVAMTWTAVSCLSAPSESRRKIGVGIALVGLGGYAFDWPLQYLVATVGLLTIGAAATRVSAEETGGSQAFYRPPPIPGPVWQDFVAKLVSAWRDRSDDSGADAASAVTVKGDDGVDRTHFSARRHRLSIRVSIERTDDAIDFIDIWCGEDGPAPTSVPTWTLHARPSAGTAAGVSHAPPPAIAAGSVRTGDAEFDRRFHIRGSASLTDALFDEGLRARATGIVDGWLAFFDDVGLRCRIDPGRGAPLDHPIPISELAFRGATAPASAERLITLIEFVSDLAARGMPAKPADD